MKEYVYQTGTINSLIQAIYEGDTTIKDLKEQGSFGIGTFDLVDGEMIACDGHFYRANSSGHLTEVDDSIKTPFAVVNHFNPDISINTDKQLDFGQLETFISDTFSFKNSIYAIKIEGNFENIFLRSEECQLKPFRPLDKTLPYLQHAFEDSNTEGTIVGYWFPKYLEQVNVPGFHFHFISTDKKLGGHIFNFKLTSAKISIQKLDSLHLDLIKTKEFEQADLYNYDLESLDAVEKHR